MRRHLFVFLSALLLVVALFLAPAPALAMKQSSHGVRAVPTYESVGLYWSSPPGPGRDGCDVQYRKAGASTWSQGLALWYDARNDECRGSLVHLAPGTAYEVELGVGGRKPVRSIQFSTWPNQWPVAKVVMVPSGGGTLLVSQGGTPTGYVLYQGMEGAVLDAQNAYAHNIEIDA